VIVSEGKRMTRAEPAVLRAAALIGMSDFKHLFSPWVVRSGQMFVRDP
jgi:hypothetical protein